MTDEGIGSTNSPLMKFVMRNIWVCGNSTILNTYVQHRTSDSALAPDKIEAVGIFVVGKGPFVVNSGPNCSIDPRLQ